MDNSITPEDKDIAAAETIGEFTDEFLHRQIKNRLVIIFNAVAQEEQKTCSPAEYGAKHWRYCGKCAECRATYQLLELSERGRGISTSEYFQVGRPTSTPTPVEYANAAYDQDVSEGAIILFGFSKQPQVPGEAASCGRHQTKDLKRSDNEDIEYDSDATISVASNDDEQASHSQRQVPQSQATPGVNTSMEIPASLRAPNPQHTADDNNQPIILEFRTKKRSIENTSMLDITAQWTCKKVKHMGERGDMSQPNTLKPVAVSGYRRSSRLKVPTQRYQG